MASTTANYGWTKPTIGGDDDVWGNEVNTDLDGIDATVKSVSTVANAAYPASNPSGYQTAAQVTAAVTAYPIGDNRLINGDMRIDQRQNGSSGTAFSVYTVDRWQWGASKAGFTWGRNLGGATGPTGFPNILAFSVTTPFTPVAGDLAYLTQIIEADMISDLAFGTAQAQSVTLSFWVYSNQTGTFSGALVNSSSNRSYPFTYVISVANTWTRIVITIPGDVAGTWVMSGNGASLNVRFDLGSGATYRGPANAWAAANYVGATGAVSLPATNLAFFSLTGVKLEIGSVATPYNRQSLAKSLADCERYYQTPTIGIVAYAGATGQTPGAFAYLATTMRAAPTLAVIAAVGSDVNVSGVNTPDLITTTSFRGSWNAAGAGICISGRQYSASAEL